jgi:DivIVA domain-containing protein
MPLTPADIHNMAFKKSALGHRGYDEEQVDALLDAVTAEMIQLLEHNDALRTQAHRAGPPGRAAEAEFAAALDELDRERRACDAAERNALGLRGRWDEARAAATAQTGSGGPILEMARRTADERVRDADREARELLVDARERSEQITQQAQAAVREIAERSRRHDSDAEIALNERHTALVREVGELAEFAEHYRAALQEHVRHQAQV